MMSSCFLIYDIWQKRLVWEAKNGTSTLSAIGSMQPDLEQTVRRPQATGRLRGRTGRSFAKVPSLG